MTKLIKRSKVKRKKIEINGELVTVQVNSDGEVGKTCKACKNFKSPDCFFIYQFHNCRSKGLTSNCKDCNASVTRHWRNKKRENILLHSVRARAKRLGEVCDLTLEDMVIPEFCPILGLKLRNSYGPRSDDSSSVDKIDITKPYSKDNIVICSWRANRLKNSITLEEMKKMHEFYKDYWD